ncbi:MAG: hypothetical protein P9M14_13945 [Candidatus Alcyoniella australis]|nr:hypothetical protein [Candidatus Alcyoniella australis]
MSAEKRTMQDLIKMKTSELDAVFEAGTTPEFEQLAGWEFRGYNHPGFTRVLGFQKFTKGFFQKDGQPFGYNVPIKQNGADNPWIAKPSDETPKRYGFYSVKAYQADDEDAAHPHALFLDYGDGDNPLQTFTWVLRDYLVQIDPENPDLYLGRAYVRVGPIKTMGSYFILERHRQAP